jgi:glycosyltransferase involved in cell wall biosynthesis
MATPARPRLKAEATGRSQALGVALMKFPAWIRSYPALRVIYRWVPQALREKISSSLAAQAIDALKFQRKNWAILPSKGTLHNTFPPSGHGRGINLFGYFRGQFGLGENARLYARALLLAGYPVALIDLDTDAPHAREDGSLDSYISHESPYPINLIFVNPDEFGRVLKLLKPAQWQSKYNMACWFWELERFPKAWEYALASVEEVLVATSFVQQAVADATDKPVTMVPIPMDDPVDSGRRRADFGIGEEFTFLVTFDFNSHIERKNPLAAIRAFQKAFVHGEDVALLVKCSNGHRHPELLSSLIEFSIKDPRITVRDDILARDDVQALQRCSDAYVSLHRSEGFGLGMAESMRLGKPVIATAYSGNMDFMTEENSCLVPYTLVPVLDGHYIHHEDQYWAEPDIEAGASFMRRLVEDPAYRQSLGRRAAEDIRSKFSPEVSAVMLIKRFEQLPLKNAVS